jgi:sugar porter (SP) family MFS transporter
MLSLDPSPVATLPQASPSAGARVLLSTVVAALGGLLFGFDTAVISGATDVLPKVFHLSSGELGFTVASALIGTIVGSAVAGGPSDRWGRRPVLSAVAALFFLSALGCALAWSWAALVAARFLGGIAVGAASVVSPMYIAEISPPRLRGRLVGVSQFNVVCGILLAFVSNLVIHRMGGLGDDAWRWMLGVQMVPAALFFLALSAIPESPRWLARQGRGDDARRVLASLGSARPDAELAEIGESLRLERARTRDPLFRRAYAFPIAVTILVATFNQLSGINALIYYASDIFAMAGAGRDSALLQSVAIGGTNLVFTLVGMALIDRLGRRTLLVAGGLGTAACLAGVAYAFYARSDAGALLLGCLIGYIAFFALSQGAVIWVLISEIFPNRVRTRGQALGSFTHWAWAAAVSWTFPVIATASGGHAFAFFAAMMLLQAALAWRFLPETKGVSLEQIQKRLGIA